VTAAETQFGVTINPCKITSFTASQLAAYTFTTNDSA